MKLDVISPRSLVDVNLLPSDAIEVRNDRVLVGANVRNSTLAWRTHHPRTLSRAVPKRCLPERQPKSAIWRPPLARSCSAVVVHISATCTLAAIRGEPGSGADALNGIKNRSHAVLGTSVQVHRHKPIGYVCCSHHAGRSRLDADALGDEAEHQLPRLPSGAGRYAGAGDRSRTWRADHPYRDSVLYRGTTFFDHPKVRDRASYEFALASGGGGWSRTRRFCNLH